MFEKIKKWSCHALADALPKLFIKHTLILIFVRFDTLNSRDTRGWDFYFRALLCELATWFPILFMGIMDSWSILKSTLYIFLLIIFYSKFNKYYFLTIFYYKFIIKLRNAIYFKFFSKNKFLEHLQLRS